MVYENKTEWRRSRSFESSKFMESVPFENFAYYEIWTWHIVTIAKNSKSNISTNLTTQLSPPINLPVVCENLKAPESNTSNDTNKYITDEN